MKFLKTISFDESDRNVFEVAAGPDEWAVSGAFAFAHLCDEEITGKTRQAFANGFLGLGSFGRSTFATVAEIDSHQRTAVEHRLALHFVEVYGAPGVAEALPAAIEECDFITELCGEALINTVFTVHRALDADGQIRESFRTIQPPTEEPMHARIWTIEDGGGE